MTHAQQYPGEDRPWGRFDVLLDAPTHKVKRILVLPGKRLSYQRHQLRSEHWFMVSGTARVTLDGAVHNLKCGDALDIPLLSWHRIENCGVDDLVFIEVQTGRSFDENDIERREDDFGRVAK